MSFILFLNALQFFSHATKNKIFDFIANIFTCTSSLNIHIHGINTDNTINIEKNMD